MRINFLKLKNFRNFSDLTVSFNRKLTFFVGKNGSGKTNILEAIRYLSIPKSFRVGKDHYLIKWNEPYLRIEGELEEDLDKKKIVAFLECNENRNCVFPKNPKAVKKTIKVNEVKIKALDLIGKFVTTIFNPEDINLIALSPQKRRRYVDMILCQVSRKYCRNLLEYKKVLAQRNKLLSNIQKGKGSVDLLEFFDKKLVEFGSPIILERKKLFLYFNQEMPKSYRHLSGGKENVELQYLPKVKDAKDFEGQLVIKREREIILGHTEVGPHRDDFVFLLDGNRIVECGSRGECRSMVLALKEAELNFIQKITQKKPVLLLDDVFSELDPERQKQLISFISGYQTVVTTTDLGEIKGNLPKDYTVYRIKDGKIAS